MEFQQWKTENAHKHLSDQVNALLSELQSLRSHAAQVRAEISPVFHNRMKELENFEQSVEKMLEAEWNRAKAVLAGHGNEYN